MNASQPKIHNTVVIIFRKKDDTGADSILEGDSLNRFCFGYWIPPGGHIEPGETMFETCYHEGPDECGLKPLPGSLVHVGTFIVAYRDSTEVHMSFLETFEWEGVLAPNPKDFKEMRFLSRSEIPWDKIPPGDSIMVNALFDNLWFDIRMRCGDSLKEALSIQSDLRPRSQA